MKIKDILNDISPRIKAKKDINKRFKRRKGKAFHSKMMERIIQSKISINDYAKIKKCL